VIKKLDILIIRSFIGPFLATFLITEFVLTMQFFWLYIDDLVGKGLDFGTLMYLTGLVALTWVPLAFPLALLLSSIMTFGNLGESFELVAIKSSGISLARFMRPLFIISVIVAGLSFAFANNIIPIANLKFNTLKVDIIRSKPALDIKEGIFYDKIEGYSIKLGKKEKDDSTIRDVIIYEKSYGLQDNFLIAQSGIMKLSADKQFLEFNLKNGWRYEEKGNRGTTKTDFIRMGFKEYKKVLDLSSLSPMKSDDNQYKDNYKMLSVRQLSFVIDSLRKQIKKEYISKSSIDVNQVAAFAKYADSSFAKVETQKLVKVKTFDELIADSAKQLVRDQAGIKANNIKGMLGPIATLYTQKEEALRLHQIEWQRKFALSFACIVLFLIGAPLGSIIRKGGLGTPLVFAIAFFVFFHMINTFGEKFAREGRYVGIIVGAYTYWFISHF
jgi:lipopolysaccharide export system permease protein